MNTNRTVSEPLAYSVSWFVKPYVNWEYMTKELLALLFNHNTISNK